MQMYLRQGEKMFSFFRENNLIHELTIRNTSV